MQFRYIITAIIAFTFIALNVFAQLPANYTLQANTIYKSVAGWDGRVDIYIPEKIKASPLLIFIHGGGWVHGRKEDEKGFTQFFDKGFVVANVEYRLADQAPAPAAIEDVRCALMYLVKNAAKLHIDKKKIIVMGGSAGGHLALMTGLLGADPLFDKSCYRATGFQILGIIDKYGPTDLSRWGSMRNPGKASSAWLGGRGNDTAFVRSLSPIAYVTTKAPPVLIIHGDADHTVPYEQSLFLFDALKKAGVKAELYTAKGGTHSNIKPEDKVQIEKLISSFTDQLLK